ncbi:hypothetical protein EZV62_003567 [Acer yangbiense]|uniref:RNase III domain-containing protein n=1 Tax=Acer yangbiense TaxID=1000413 RepID=A0A5C7IIZ2_9ROSI|nr:hypothetical protein EZV62_003567 [Acer yangbiense]
MPCVYTLHFSTMSLSSFPSSSSTSSLRVRASFDTQQRLSYNPNAPKNPKKTLASTAKPPPPLPLTLTTRFDPSVFDLLKRPSQGLKANLDESYMGYDVWLPNAPKVQKPRSVFNAAALAYIGDCIYEDTLLQKLLEDDYLSAQERDVLRWGKNVGTSKTRTRRRVGTAVYNRASSLETLIGYLYLTNVNRLEKVMVKLGFSTGVSTQMILEQANGQLTAM